MAEDKDRGKRQKTAVALSYDPEEVAPKIIASGRGYLADKIIEEAKEHKVPTAGRNSGKIGNRGLYSSRAL